MKKSLLTQVLQQCRRELREHPQYEHFPHWTFLVNTNNQIISFGVNREHEPPRSLGYHDVICRDKSKEFKPKWHSELDAVKRCRFNLCDSIAINIRLNKAGEAKLSMPCKACRNLLYVTNVKRCYFTTDYGWGCYECL